MTNKERLEKIKKVHSERIKQNELYTADFTQVEWLIEQAEKVETLEVLLKQRLKFTEYEQTLEYYADEENYKDCPSEIEQDNGKLARDVLSMKY